MSDLPAADGQDYTACGVRLIARNLGLAGGTARVQVYCELPVNHDGLHYASILFSGDGQAKVAQGRRPADDSGLRAVGSREQAKRLWQAWIDAGAYRANGTTSEAIDSMTEAIQAVFRAHPNRDGESDVRPWNPEDGDKRCQECGRPNVVWYTDHDLWNRVMPDDGVLCMACFIERAEQVVGIGVAWSLMHETVPSAFSEFARGVSAGRALRIDECETENARLRAILAAEPTDTLRAAPSLIEMLTDKQHEVCAYGTREGDGRPCDCKFGLNLRGEHTGCAELRAAIRTLRALDRIEDGPS